MINIMAPINQFGYGLTGINIIKSLSKITDVALCPIGQPQVSTQEDAEAVSQAISLSKMPDFSAPCIKIWHQFDMAQFFGKGLRIGFPIFELDEFNPLEKHHLSSLDKILVCSQWAKEIILNGIDVDESNVHVVPLGVDTNIFRPTPPTQRIDKTIFFNCGKWEVRKGHDILSTAFNQAFSEKDDVELWMMCDNPFFSKEEQSEWISLYKGSKLGEKIHIVERVQTQEEVYNVMAQTDCGIFPSRAEGWNLELLEMMACGKQVIATNYSAHTEFCNPDNCRLINTDSWEKEAAYDGKWFHGQHGKWLKIEEQEIHAISKCMQEAHTTPKSTNNAGIETSTQYSWDNSASKIMEILQHV